MKQLSLDVLRTFVTVVDLGNFNRAGELLGRSQPAISLQIKKLEGQLNKKLFVKVGQSYQVNADGNWLYTKAKSMLAMNDDIFRELGSQGLRGRLRLGIPSEFASVLLPSIVGEFSQRYPDVSLDVTSALSKNLLASANANQFDLILALLNPSEDIAKDDKRLSAIEVVRTDELVWVGDKHRAVWQQNKGPINLQKPQLNIQQLTLPLVLAPDGCVYRSRVIKQLKQQTQPWKITYTNPDFYGLVAALKQGLGITALARSIVPNDLEILKDKSLPQLGSINICLLNQDSQHPQVSKTLSNFIKARIA